MPMDLPARVGILSIGDLAGTTKAMTSRRRIAMVSPLVGITASLRTMPYRFVAPNTMLDAVAGAIARSFRHLALILLGLLVCP